MLRSGESYRANSFFPRRTGAGTPTLLPLAPLWTSWGAGAGGAPGLTDLADPLEIELQNMLQNSRMEHLLIHNFFYVKHIYQTVNCTIL